MTDVPFAASPSSSSRSESAAANVQANLENLARGGLPGSTAALGKICDELRGYGEDLREIEFGAGVSLSDRARAFEQSRGSVLDALDNLTVQLQQFDQFIADGTFTGAVSEIRRNVTSAALKPINNTPSVEKDSATTPLINQVYATHGALETLHRATQTLGRAGLSLREYCDGAGTPEDRRTLRSLLNAATTQLAYLLKAVKI